jgi:hypothetical protein
MLGKYTKQALIGGLVLLASTVLATTAFADTTAYGGISFNAIYSLGTQLAGNGDLGLHKPAKADTLGGGGTMLFGAHASKFGVKSSMDSDAGKITAVFEADANGRPGLSAIGGDSSAPGIRLRHAYGTIGNLLLGRTWGGLVTDFSWFPSVIDPNGPYGASVVYGDPRMAQVRYTIPMDANKVVISAENGSGIRAALFEGDNASSLPRIVAGYYMNLDGMKIQGVLAMSTWRMSETSIGPIDTDGKPTSDLTTTGTAFGVNAAIPVGMGTVKIHFLTGAAGYQMSAQANLGAYPAGIYPDPDAAAGSPAILANPGTDMTLSYSHKLDDVSKVNFTYGSISLGAAEDSGASADSATSMHLNYQWTVAKGVSMGVEYGSKTVNYLETAKGAADDESASNSAIMYSASFSF